MNAQTRYIYEHVGEGETRIVTHTNWLKLSSWGYVHAMVKDRKIGAGIYVVVDIDPAQASAKHPGGVKVEMFEVQLAALPFQMGDRSE